MVAAASARSTLSDLRHAGSSLVKRGRGQYGNWSGYTLKTAPAVSRSGSTSVRPSLTCWSALPLRAYSDVNSAALVIEAVVGRTIMPPIESDIQGNSPRVLVFTTVYPNRAAPLHGLFVYERNRHLAQHAALYTVAPVAWHQRLRRRPPSHEPPSGMRVAHPTFFYLPRLMKILDGFFLFISTLVTVWRLHRAFGFRPNRRPFRLSRWLRSSVVGKAVQDTGGRHPPRDIDPALAVPHTVRPRRLDYSPRDTRDCRRPKPGSPRAAGEGGAESDGSHPQRRRSTPFLAY